MKAFAALYRCLDETTKTSRKLACLENYFAHAPPADAAWVVYFLSGRKPKRLVLVRDLAAWCIAETGIPAWLFDECYDAVGDFGETIALLLPDPAQSTDVPLHVWAEDRLLSLAGLPPDQQRAVVVSAWHEMDRTERFIWNKLLTGAFRVGVSQGLLIRAIAGIAKVPPAVIAHRLMGNWTPSADFYRSLISTETTDAQLARPYPFCLAHPLTGDPAELGPIAAWQAEWKWDGIRAQIIRRAGELAIWSRGEELITDRFPEIAAAAQSLPSGIVLDGEIVAWSAGAVMPFGALQRRIGRKTLSPKLLADVPTAFIAFDSLEHQSTDLRTLPLRQRREHLETILLAADSDHLLLSPVQSAATWEDLARNRLQAREQHVEGLMLKSLDSPYAVGRVTGLWWKWKIDPHTVDAVLIYAQQGHGRRAGLYTDYTFGVWQENQLVPFAKAYSGLTDDEIREVDRFIRNNTLERHGPVRRVRPELVFELAFENIQLSNRHRSGLAVRFPRIARWRTDKVPLEADTLESIKALLPRGRESFPPPTLPPKTRPPGNDSRPLPR